MNFPPADPPDLMTRISRMESLIAFLTDRCNNLDDIIEGRAGEQFSDVMKKFSGACMAIQMQYEQLDGKAGDAIIELRKDVNILDAKVRHLSAQFNGENSSNTESEVNKVKLGIIRSLFPKDESDEWI